MHLDGRYRLPLGLALSLHELQVRQSTADRLTVLLSAELIHGCVSVASASARSSREKRPRLSRERVALRMQLVDLTLQPWYMGKSSAGPS